MRQGFSRILARRLYIGVVPLFFAITDLWQKRDAPKLTVLGIGIGAFELAVL